MDIPPKFSLLPVLQLLTHRQGPYKQTTEFSQQVKGINLSLAPAAQLGTHKSEVPATLSDNKVKGLGPRGSPTHEAWVGG